MKKTYKFGEMMMALREEFKECKYLLDELNKCISIETNYSDAYFSASLSCDNNIQELKDREIKLFVEKKYLNILKKLQHLKYDWYSKYLYKSIFMVERQDGDIYGLSYDNILTPVDGKKYIPQIEIIDQNKFSSLIDELFSSDLMLLKSGYFTSNHDTILLNFDNALVSTPLGDSSFMSWNGINDQFNYYITRHSCPKLIEDILSLEMPADRISSDWLKLLEKHKNAFGTELVFDVDVNTKSRKGILYVSEIGNNGVVKLIRKLNPNNK